ncbi:glycosyltransferase family 4 protein [Phenylobacterium sp.]|uniref:glycosyltransferase family 4 protein n=1 Tax=Phenylobacterium sp. TaxID=1871053 RepID=UPI00374D0528
MLEALGEHADIVEIIRKPWPTWFDVPRRIILRLSKGRYDPYWSLFWSRLGGHATVERLKRANCDAVVAVAATPIAARLSEEIATVFVSDATFFVMADYNINFQRLSPAIKKSANALEGMAIRGAAIATFPSRWAQSSALEHFHADQETTFQIPWGANLEARATTPAEMRQERPWRLLFVGVDWYGKGGDTTLETIEALKARGCDVQLDIVGCAPSDPPPQIEGVTFHGFISKNTPEGRDRLEELFRRAHLFILPTRFDAFPTVIAESASYGVPTISYRTGGVPSNVLHGQTGILIEEGAPAEAFAEAIADLMSAPERYRAMANAAFRFSRESLNWGSWAQRIVSSITEQLEKRKAAAALAN